MEEALDRLLRALADATRRGLLDRLRDAPGQTLSQLQAGFERSRQALSKHLAVLEEAGLVVPVWRGREKLHYLNPAPLQALPARWVTATEREADAAAALMREAVATAAVAADGGPQAAAVAQAAPARRAAPVARDAVADPVAVLLMRPPPAALQGQPVLHDGTLNDARAYLAETADAVRAVRAALGAMPAGTGYAAPADGSFALVEHLWHLADIEERGWRTRFERILAKTRPRLPGVDGDRLALEKRYREQPWRGAARRFLSERRRSLALLAQFDEAVLRRPVHFAGLRTRAGGVVAAAVAHDLDHRPAMAARWLDEVTQASRAAHPTRGAGRRDPLPNPRSQKR